MTETTPWLILQADMTAAEQRSFVAGTVTALSAPRPEPGHVNEDAAGILSCPDGKLIVAVADGMGGHVAGEQASRIAIESVLDCVEKSPGEMRDAILAGFDTADRRIATDYAGAGTTLVVAAVENGTFRTFHCGDAAAIATGGRGRIKHRTIDHSPVGYALESGLMTPEEAMTHADRHIVSSYVGSGEMRVEMSHSVRLRPRDTIVLASDGLFDNLLDTEVAAMAYKGPVEKAAASLLAETRQRMDRAAAGSGSGKPDDLTIAIFRPSR